MGKSKRNFMAEVKDDLQDVYHVYNYRPQRGFSSSGVVMGTSDPHPSVATPPDTVEAHSSTGYHNEHGKMMFSSIKATMAEAFSELALRIDKELESNEYEKLKDKECIGYEMMIRRVYRVPNMVVRSGPAISLDDLF